MVLENTRMDVSMMPSPPQDKLVTSWKAALSEDSASKNHNYCNKEIGNISVILYKGVGGSRGKRTNGEGKGVSKSEPSGKPQRAAVPVFLFGEGDGSGGTRT